MIARRFALAFASILVLGALQPAQAETWSPFDWWARPIPTTITQWGQPAPAVVAHPPRAQRVAVVAEPVRRPPPRMLIIGIGF